MQIMCVSELLSSAQGSCLPHHTHTHSQIGTLRATRAARIDWRAFTRVDCEGETQKPSRKTWSKTSSPSMRLSICQGTSEQAQEERQALQCSSSADSSRKHNVFVATVLLLGHRQGREARKTLPERQCSESGLVRPGSQSAGREKKAWRQGCCRLSAESACRPSCAYSDVKVRVGLLTLSTNPARFLARNRFGVN